MIAAGRRAADETARPAARMLLQADAAIPRHSEATAVELANGGVLLAWCEMDGTGDNAASRMRAMVSSDRGHTWGPRRLLLEHTAGINAIGLALRRLADGTLGLAYSHRDSRTAAGRLFVTSGDEGSTWTGLRSLEVVSPVAPARITRLPQSDLLFLVWNWSYSAGHRGGGLRRPLACAVSEDGGDTWPWSRRKVLADEPSATYCYPTCLWLGDEAFVTYLTMPAPEVGGPLQRTRSLKSMHLPLSWITR